MRNYVYIVTKYKGLFVVLMILNVVLVPFMSLGELVFYEDFGSTAGELVGTTLGSTNGGFHGWFGSTYYSDGGTVLIQDVAFRSEASLFYTSADGLEVDGGNVAMDYNKSRWQKAASTVCVMLGQSLSNDVYVSMLVHVTDDGDNTAGDLITLYFDGVQGWINNESGNADSVRNIGVGLSYSNVVAVSGSSPMQNPAVPNALNSTHFVVARFRRDGTSYYKYIDWWLDPTYAELSSDTGYLTYTTVNTLGYNIDSLVFGQQGLDSGDLILFDEIRVGTELSDVYPDREPVGTVFVVK